MTDASPGGDDARRRETVSVVIPVKDDGTALARCLAALRAQSRRPDEIIVVDNGSSDGSGDVARAAGAIVVPCDEPGIPAASARGYDHATGDLILRLDADCVPPACWVEEVTAAFAERQDVAAFSGRAHFIDGPSALRVPLATAYLLAFALVTSPALGHLPLFGSNLAMRRQAWRAVGSRVHRHDAHLHDDLDLAYHIGARFRIRFLKGTPMGISMRPFHSGRGFLLRLYRGFRTVTVHWPRDFPPYRWRRLVFHRRAMPAAAERSRADVSARSKREHSWASPAAPLIGSVEPPAIHVMTWNVRRRFAHRGWRSADDWRLRAPHLAALLRAERPTLLAVQEALPDQARFVRETLGETYRSVGHGRASGRAR